MFLFRSQIADRQAFEQMREFLLSPMSRIEA